MERINPMYGIVNIPVPEFPVFIRAVEVDWEKWNHDPERNKWIQEIKSNYRRNKRKRRRCKRKGY